MSNEKLILEELARRAAMQESATGKIAAIRAELFDKQLAAWDDPSRLVALLCTRRAGKTQLWARLLVATCLTQAGVLARAWAQVRLRVKQLLWQDILELCARHDIPVRSHETELTVRFENGSEIRLVGADNDGAAQRKRGDATVLEIILEAQSWGPFLRGLIEDVATPSLFDRKGKLYLEGTPGPTRGGYWWAVSGDNDVDSRWVSKGQVADGELVGAGWSCHRWSLLDNPFMPRWTRRPNWRELAKQAVKEEMEQKGWTEQTPTFVREYLGRWVRDDSALYYAVSEKLNTYDPKDITPWGPGWTHVLGLDVGWTDATAITVWGWHENDPNLYEAYCWAESKVLAPDVAARIQELNAQGFNIVKMVGDFGGGGRLYLEDIRARFGLQIDDAQKSGTKWSHTMVFNDSLRSGIVKMVRGGELFNEMSTLPRAPDWTPLEGKPPKEHPGFENHRSDAAAYSFRECLHMFIQPYKKKIVRGTQEYVDEQEAKYVESLEKRELEEQEWWDTGEYNGSEF